MDLILWRHAEAEDHAPEGDDLSRGLTPRGQKQAAKMAIWLDRQLPEGTRIYCSPALRTEQTALALGRKFKLKAELAPGATPEQLMHIARWPEGKSTVLMVGHQPTLGQTLAHILGTKQRECVIRKGAVWWLRWREREANAVVVAVASPETL